MNTNTNTNAKQQQPRVFLEQKVEEQAIIIEELKTNIEKMNNKMNDIRSVVSQLVGGLFHKETQKKVIETHLCILFSDNNDNDNLSHDEHDNHDDDEDSKYDPTTRQGDECMNRIQSLEKRMNEFFHIAPMKQPLYYSYEDHVLKKWVKEDYERCNYPLKYFNTSYSDYYEEEDDDDASSFHSSAPSLIEIQQEKENQDQDHDDDNDTHSSMPSLIGMDLDEDDEDDDDEKEEDEKEEDKEQSYEHIYKSLLDGHA